MDKEKLRSLIDQYSVVYRGRRYVNLTWRTIVVRVDKGEEFTLKPIGDKIGISDKETLSEADYVDVSKTGIALFTRDDIYVFDEEAVNNLLEIRSEKKDEETLYIGTRLMMKKFPNLISALFLLHRRHGENKYDLYDGNRAEVDKSRIPKKKAS